MLVKKIFKVGQYVLELILGSDNFLALFEKYYCFEVSMKLLNLSWGELNLSRLVLLFTKPFLLTKRLKAKFLWLIIFFDTTSYPERVSVIKYYCFSRNEISNYIKDIFIEEHYLFVYINIIKCFFPVKIGDWGLNTVRIRREVDK